MAQKELTNVFKHIVKKCDMLINNDHYEADAYIQDTVEDIAELCNHILDGDYGKLVEVKEVDLEKEINKYISDNFFGSETMGFFAVRTNEEPNDQDMALCAKHFFELGLKAKDIDVENSFNAIVCKIGSTYLKEMDKDAIIKTLEPYKDGDKVKIIIKAQKGE